LTAAPQKRKPGAVRRPSRLHELPIETGQQESLSTFTQRSLPELVPAGANRSIGDFGSVRVCIEVDLGGASLRDGTRLTDDATSAAVERKCP
jgi:hypothetical protein